MFDAERFLLDFNIQHWTEGKNVGPGWVNVTCPYCDDGSNHGGFNVEGEYYHCWKCRWHPMNEVLGLLTGLELSECMSMVQKYTSNSARFGQFKHKRRGSRLLTLPQGASPLSEVHKEYLHSRNFDPDYLADEFNLVGTGRHGPYKFRIIAPIYFDGELVSYQGRDITGQATLRYKACPRRLEVTNHQHLLYHIDRTSDRAVLVEGIADVWRLGAGAISTFGMSLSQQQVTLLSQRYTKVSIVFDSGKEAQGRADEIGKVLSGFGIEVEILELPEGDPADLSQDDANNLMKEVLE